MHVNEQDFQVLRLLGKGKGGYSYLVTDGREQYVLKQIHHEPCDYYTFGNKLESELRDYQRLKDMGIPMPELLDVDRERERLLKAYIPGDTVEKLVQQDRLPEDALEQMAEICRILYENGINIDYYPTNFAFRDGKLHYIDYECNGYMTEWNFENWGSKYWSKTPEFRKAFE